MTTPATTQELIADVLLPYFGDDEQAYNVACEIERDPAITVRPRRILSGEWRDVTTELEALPIGAQIRWGLPSGTQIAVHTECVTGYVGWSIAGAFGVHASDLIARDNTPIEVIA